MAGGTGMRTQLSIGELIIHLRGQHGLTQYELADQLAGVSGNDAVTGRRCPAGSAASASGTVLAHLAQRGAGLPVRALGERGAGGPQVPADPGAAAAERGLTATGAAGHRRVRHLDDTGRPWNQLIQRATTHVLMR
ncbi:hypothetical protein GCM10018954_043290 [Kutzneria kofuensis]